MNRDNLIHKLGEKLVKDIGSRRKDWAQLVVVGSFDGDEAQMNGFAYYSNGTNDPAAPRDFSTIEILRELRDAMAVADGQAPWVASSLSY